MNKYKTEIILMKAEIRRQKAIGKYLEIENGRKKIITRENRTKL